MHTVLLTFVLVLAILNRRELFARHLLEGFRAADITGVRVDKEKRFDFGHSRDNPPHRNQPSEVNSLDFTDSHRRALGQRFEIEVARSRLKLGPMCRQNTPLTISVVDGLGTLPVSHPSFLPASFRFSPASGGG